MGASRKTTKSTSTGSSRKGHWKNLTRDSRGRWVKRQSSGVVKSPKKPAVKRSHKASQRKPALKKPSPTKSKQASQILDGIQKDFEKICPRCSGDLKFFKIRCGPQKLVSVRKSKVCNFWIPITDK